MFGLSGSRNLDVDPMTFIYELDPLLWRYAACANMNFLRQGFRKLSNDRHTDIQTRPNLYTMPLRGWSKMRCAVIHEHVNTQSSKFVVMLFPQIAMELRGR